jgi:hypothetical protein
MNWLKEIQIAAFKDELQKLAKIDVGSRGEIIYHSKDQDTDKQDKAKINPRTGPELYSEDSAGGTEYLQTQPTPQ